MYLVLIWLGARLHACSRLTLNVYLNVCLMETEVSVLHILNPAALPAEFRLASAKLVLLPSSDHSFDIFSPQVKTLQRLEEDFTLKRNFSKICTCIWLLLKPLHKTWTIEIEQMIQLRFSWTENH